MSSVPKLAVYLEIPHFLEAESGLILSQFSDSPKCIKLKAGWVLIVFNYL